MFTNVKKDYYSVNANISLSPITEQQQLQKMLQNEQSATMNAMTNLQDQSMHGSGQDDSSVYQQENLVNQGQGRMYAIAEHLQNPISTRYDDIYHPRTDKRVIRK